MLVDYGIKLLGLKTKSSRILFKKVLSVMLHGVEIPLCFSEVKITNYYRLSEIMITEWTAINCIESDSSAKTKRLNY